MRKVIGIGETILDILFKDNQPYRAVPGGSVFNGFVSLGRLGVPLVFISELGNDRVGDIIRDFMRENNIPEDYVDCFPDGKSPVSIAFLDENNNADYIFYKNYPNQRLESPLPRIEEDDILIFGSYYALNPALRERTIEFLEYAKERKAILYYDPNFRSAHAHEAVRLRAAILENFEYADIIRGSEEDFFNIFGDNNMEKVYKDRVKFYCPNLIVTRGAGEVMLFSESGCEKFPVPQVSPVSAIGAGDNFNAGIIYGILKYGLRRENLSSLTKETWRDIIRCGIELAVESCRSSDNYISKSFASSYAQNR
ncbi:MAG: carbohydrate kinase [Tannerellaceae bacterium]|jgi:fructokinase|nr:carbohydrate kinase [Tannerellaceae bacterium]